MFIYNERDLEEAERQNIAENAWRQSQMNNGKIGHNGTCATLIIVALVLLALLSGCVPPPRVIVAPGVVGDHDAIKQEVFDAIDFVREYADMEKFKWEHQLKVEIYQEPLSSCGEDCVTTGLYWSSRDLVQVMWMEGSCENALIHELIHRVSHLMYHGNGYFGGVNDRDHDNHCDEFEQVVEPAEHLWRNAGLCTPGKHL